MKNSPKTVIATSYHIHVVKRIRAAETRYLVVIIDSILHCHVDHDLKTT